MNQLPHVSLDAFWDTDIEQLDPVKDKNFVIYRVFEYGRMDDIISIISQYGKQTVIKSLVSRESLREGTIYLACLFFNLLPSQFKCYTKAPYHPI